MAINSGVNISKAVGFAVLDKPLGVDFTKAVAFAVLDAVSAPAWPGIIFPDGFLNNAYSASLLVTGTLPITLTQPSGTYPTGLSAAISGNSVTLSGTPTANGSFTFTLRLTNSYGVVDYSFTVVIRTPTGESNYAFVA
jgi:hypothetical protein